MLCNDVVSPHTLAYHRGNHGDLSQCPCGRSGKRTWMLSYKLCVCQVHWTQPTLLLVPISQLGCCLAAHGSVQAVLCSQTGLLGNPSWCAYRWRHGLSGGRCGSKDGRLIPASRQLASWVPSWVYIPCRNKHWHQGVHARSVVGWYAALYAQSHQF